MSCRRFSLRIHRRADAGEQGQMARLNGLGRSRFSRDVLHVHRVMDDGLRCSMFCRWRAAAGISGSKHEIGAE